MQAAAEAAAATAAAALARGKRGKAKKAKEKYAHQDDEDRQLALQFLAPAGERFPACKQISFAECGYGCRACSSQEH